MKITEEKANRRVRLRDTHGLNVKKSSSMIWLPVVIADSKQDMTVIKHWPLGCHTSALTTELKYGRQLVDSDSKR